MRSRLSLILGLVLAVGAFAALLLLGQVLNPTPYQVVVVINEVAPGEQLRYDMIATDPQSVDPKVAAEYVLADELDGWLGSTIVDPLHPGQPLLKAHLVREGHPRADHRLSLALEETDKVAMVIPVDAETAPQDIRPGDRVDLVYGVGRVREESGVSESAPWLDQELTPSPAITPAYQSSLTPTPMPNIDFPFAKVVLQDLEVVRVIHEKRSNPAYGGPQSEEPPTLKGDVKALQVVLPREQAEMMHYGVTTGDYRVALLSPNAPEAADATLGMTWKDLEAFFWAQRDTALGAITGTISLDGPGAAALVLTPELTPMAPMTETESITASTASESEITPTVPAGDDTGLLLDKPVPATPTPGADAPAPETRSPESESDDGQSPPLDLGRMVSPSMIQGLICTGGGLLLAALVVVAGIRVFRRVRTGSD